MSTQQRELIHNWLPLVLAIFTNIALVAYGYGQLRQSIAPLEKHAEAAAGAFVSRQEWGTANQYTERRIGEVREDLRRIDEKLDRLLARE